MMSSPPITDVIAREILEGRCVLVLGPNAFMADKGDGDLRPIKEVVLNIVARKYGIEGEVASFEEILSKMPPENSGRFLILQSDIAQVLRELEDSAQLSPLSDKIASLPFKIIFNAGPDNLLTDVFARLAIPFYNAFYDFDAAGQRSNDEFEFGEQFPTLIYNLYGSVMKPESLVFTSRNQDRYEKAIIRHGLPVSIKRELLRNDTFVFLGFDGKDWTTRQTNETLFSENSESNRQRKIAVGPETSVSYSFGGDFYPMGINEFVDEVFERCLQLDPDFESKRPQTSKVPLEQSKPRSRYPGIKPFEESDQNIFFGREPEVEQLANSVLKKRVTTLFGPAGIGKTSILQAGCAPIWIRERFVPIFLRVFIFPMGKSLTDTIFEQLKQSPYVLPRKSQRSGSSDRTLWEKINDMDFILNGSPATPVLIFDQFEEIFTFPEEERSGYIRELSSIAYETTSESSREFYEELPEENPIDLSMVFSIRSNVLEQIAGLEQQIPGIYSNRIKLSTPNPNDYVRNAIIRPAMQEGDFISPKFTYSEKAIAQIIEFLKFPDTLVSAEPSSSFLQVQLIGQHIESKIIEQGAQPGFMVTPEFYGNQDGLEDILTGLLKAGMAALSHEEQEIAIRMFEDELISYNSRLSVPENILLSRPGISTKLLTYLVDARFLRLEMKQGVSYYEISNDSLLPIIIVNRAKRARAEAQAKREIEAQERQKQLTETDLLARFSAPGPKYLLAIEGGDAEVLGQLALLAAFEEKMRTKTGNSNYRISDTFDLIGGAGLGNLVAMQLSLGRTVLKIKEDLESMSNDVRLTTFSGVTQRLARHYAEEERNPTWETGFCYLKDASETWLEDLTNHPEHKLLLSVFLAKLANPSGHASLSGPTHAILLHIATHSNYPFGWSFGEENLHIFSVESVGKYADLGLESSRPSQVIKDRLTEVKLKQLGNWIYEGYHGQPPLGFQPARLKRLVIPLEMEPSTLEISDWDYLYNQAQRELESFDLSPFLPKTST